MPANAINRTPELKPPFTILEFAGLHGVSRSVVRKWMNQGRLPHERRGGGTGRAGMVLILTAERPDRLAPGGLSPEQRRKRK